MKKLYLWKRTLAGLLAFVVVSGAVPVDLGGLSKTGKFISAQADNSIIVNVKSIKTQSAAFDWDDLFGNDSYTFYISEDKDFADNTTRQYTGNNTAHIEKNLKPDTKYYFKVETTTGGYTSGTGYFNTLAPTDFFDNVGVTGITDTGVKVEWNSLGNDRLYKVYVSETPDFENVTPLQTTNILCYETGLNPGTNYYFKVEAFSTDDPDNVRAVGKTWYQTSKTVNLFYNTPDKDSVTLSVDEELTKELFKVKYGHEPNDDELKNVEYQWYDEDDSKLGLTTEITVNFDENQKNDYDSFYYVPLYNSESLYDLGLGRTKVKYNYGISSLSSIVGPEKNKEDTEHNMLEGDLTLEGCDQNYAMRYGVSDSKYNFGENNVVYDNASDLNANEKLKNIGFKYIWVKAVDTTIGTNTIMEPVCIGFTAVYPEDELLIKPEFKTDVKVSTDGVNILKEGTGIVDDTYKDNWVWVYSFDNKKTWSENPVLKKDGEIKVWYALAYKTADGDYEVMEPTSEFADIDAEPVYADTDFDISTNTIIEFDDNAANAVITISNGEIASVEVNKDAGLVPLVKDTDYTVKKNNDGTYTIRAVLDSGYSGSITGKIIENKFFRQWNKEDALPMSGSWYLDKDVTVNDFNGQAYVEVRNNTEYDLDLNGKAVVINGDNVGAAVYVTDSGTFKLYDSDENINNKHYYAKPIENSPAKIITDENNIDDTTPYFMGGYISVPNGRAVYSNGGKFYMINSTIFGCGNTAVCLSNMGDDNVATISDSAIIGNISTTSNAGGGFILNNSKARINDSLIADNVAENGGGMYITGATSGAQIEKSRITNNVSKEAGGGISINETNNVSIKDSTIDANVAVNHGGAIFAYRSIVGLDNVTVEKNIRYVSDNNTPKTVDDNIFLSDGSRLTLNNMPTGKKLGVGIYTAGEFLTNDNLTFTNTSGEGGYIRDYFTSESDDFYIMADNGGKAVFAAKPVIKFNENGGTGTMADMKIDPLVDKVPECKIAPPNGKEFDKWIDANNNNEFAVGDALTTYIGEAQAILTAQWKDKLVLVSQTEKLYLPTGYGTGNKLKVEIDTTNAESYNYTYQWYKVNALTVELHNNNNQQNNETGKTVTDEILRKSTPVPNANEATFEIPVGNEAGKYEYFCEITAKAKNNKNDPGEAFYSKIIPVTVADVTANIKFEGNKAIEVTNVKYDNVPLRSSEYVVNITESGSAGQIKITLNGENQSGSTIFPYIHTSAVASTHYAEGNIEYWTYNGVNYAKDKNNKFQIVNDTSVSKVAGGTRVEKVEKNGYTYIKVYCELCGKLLSYKRIKIKS